MALREWRSWSSSRRVYSCYTTATRTPRVPAAAAAAATQQKKSAIVLWPCHIQRRVENKETDWERESRSLLPPPPLYFLAAVNFHSVLLLFLPHAGRCAPLVCCCCCCCLFGVGWLISVGFSSFFRCLRWGKILLRDYQFTWHSPFVLCVPPEPSFFFHSTPWVSPHHADIIFFRLFFFFFAFLVFFFFVFYLTQDLNLLPAVRERETKRNFRLLVYDVNKGREIIMAVRRNTIIFSSQGFRFYLLVLSASPSRCV